MIGVYALSLCLWATAAQGGPWAETGDATLRSDIEVLAAAGVIDNVTMQWPLPWAGVVDRLDQPSALDGQPDYVRQAFERVRSRAGTQSRSGELRSSVTFDATNGPNVIRGFDALGREDVQGQASVEYMWRPVALHLALGAQTVGGRDRQVFVPDDSYIAVRLGDAVVYAGYLTHWWGPGWISALSLSNNARPVPQIGISRVSTAPFESPWLSWIGPWQLEFFVGVLDDPRIARNTVYNGFRFGFSPLPGLEIGLSRTDMMCGTGHACKPLTGYFNIYNDDNRVNLVNDEGAIDVRYSGVFGHWTYALYAQAMNEDTNPLIHSGTSHLFGGSLWTSLAGVTGRLTVEYADSIATRDLWGSGTFHGVAYNNYSYTDGMRYRGRTLGFSLDSDSRLLSAQMSFTDRRARSLTVTYHHANVSDALNLAGNAVTASPVVINQIQARVALPIKLGEHAWQLDLEARYQDDQPRPEKGALGAVEARLRVPL